MVRAILSRRLSRPPAVLGALVVFTALISGVFPAAAGRALAQSGPDSPALIAAQQEAMKRLAFMDGVWRGPAWTIIHTGDRHEVIQTERIGPFLGGAVKVIEGRGYDAQGEVSFNALGIVSYNPQDRSYTMRSYALGHSGDFPVTLTGDGFTWEIPAGSMTIRYTAVVKDGKWKEVGHRIVPGQEPVQFFEMNLERVGDTDWPGAGAIPPR